MKISHFLGTAFLGFCFFSCEPPSTPSGNQQKQEEPPEEQVYYKENVNWDGPGFYWGIWFGNRDDYYYWHRHHYRDRYYYPRRYPYGYYHYYNRKYHYRRYDGRHHHRSGRHRR